MVIFLLLGFSQGNQRTFKRTLYKSNRRFWRGAFWTFNGYYVKRFSKITDLRYDEYFADTEEEIKDAKLKAYSRQSKYFSKDYAQKSGENFKKEVDDLRKKAIEENKLVSPTNEEAWSENYQRLVKKITSQ